MSLADDLVSWWRTVLASRLPGDLANLTYLALAYRRRQPGPPREVHPRSLPGESILLRPGTRDLVTYHDVFVRQYQRSRLLGVPVRTIVDVGANIGLVSRYLAHAFPQAEILAVEMDVGNYALLRQNLLPLGARARTLHAAAWTHAEGVTYRPAAAEDAYAVEETVAARATSARREADPPAAGPPTAVRSVTPAMLVSMFDGRDVDFMKIDIEGAETTLLLAADVSWLERVRRLQVEVHEPQDVGPVTGVLKSQGFAVEPSRAHWAALEAWRP